MMEEVEAKKMSCCCGRERRELKWMSDEGGRGEEDRDSWLLM